MPSPTVLLVQELLDHMRARATVEGGHEYTHVYLVRFQTRPTSPHWVFTAKTNAAAVPRLGWPHADDAFARVVSVEPQQKGDSLTEFEVVVRFSTKGPDEGNPNEIENPLNRPPEWNFEWQGREVEMVRDFNGKPVLNSAGRPFEQQPTDTIFSPIMNVSYFMEAYPLWAVKAYCGAVNTDNYRLCGFDMPKFTTRLWPAGAHLHREAGITCVRVAWKFELRDPLTGQDPGDQWDAHPLDQGYMRVEAVESDEGPSLDYVPFTDKEGNQRQEPTPLNGQGEEYVPPPVGGEDPVFTYLQFQRGARLPFRDLGFPT
jgi:hypothetical protein